MAKHQQGIFISIKAWLPMGETIDDQLESLTMVKEAHASGDYTKLLSAAKVEEIKTDQKTRRVEDEPKEEKRPDDELDKAERGEVKPTPAETKPAPKPAEAKPDTKPAPKPAEAKPDIQPGAKPQQEKA